MLKLYFRYIPKKIPIIKKKSTFKSINLYLQKEKSIKYIF